MNWTGKLIGALLGFSLTKRATGVLLGLILGHLYDVWIARRSAGPHVDAATVRTTFFRAAFTVMGHVAKSDGRVSEQDIAAARRIFRQFNLGEADTRAAMQFFTEGKQPGFDPGAVLAELAAACRGRPAVLRMFLEIQMRAALMAEGLEGATRAALLRVASAVGIGALEFAHLEAFLRFQAQAGPRAAPGRTNSLDQSYEVLGMRPDASDAEVKRAYRKLMSENHPDKLVARGLPESMLEVAKEKTQAIQAAWESIRVARGLR
jgi:DnaJ like chaperone protein